MRISGVLPMAPRTPETIPLVSRPDACLLAPTPSLPPSLDHRCLKTACTAAYVDQLLQPDRAWTRSTHHEQHESGCREER